MANNGPGLNGPSTPAPPKKLVPAPGYRPIPGYKATYGPQPVAPSAGTVDGVPASVGTQGAVGTPAPASGSGHGQMTPQQVRSMQQFLKNKGFNITVDGLMGPQTRAAGAAYRADNKNGAVNFNKTAGQGVHPGTSLPANDPNAGSGGTGGGSGSSSTGGQGAFAQLLTALLKSSSGLGVGTDPTAFGNAQAAPSLALAAADARQIGANPLQEAQNQSDISSWYGLDPKASSYKLSVLGRLGQAGKLDQTAGNEAGTSAQGIAQALAGSIGGSANAGSDSVAQVGANAAGTDAAIGAANADYANQMNPLIAADARGRGLAEKASNSQVLQALQDKLATDKGAATATAASGAATARDSNNQLVQQRFADRGNLLSVLAQMQAVDPNSAPLKDALLQAEIGKTNSGTLKNLGLTTPTGSNRAPKNIDLGSATKTVAGIVGANGNKLPANTSLGGVARLIGTQIQAMGIPKSDPRYQRIGQTILNSFVDAAGNPLNVPPGWFGPNTK